MVVVSKVGGRPHIEAHTATDEITANELQFW